MIFIFFLQSRIFRVETLEFFEAIKAHFEVELDTNSDESSYSAKCQEQIDVYNKDVRTMNISHAKQGVIIDCVKDLLLSYYNSIDAFITEHIFGESADLQFTEWISTVGATREETLNMLSSIYDPNAKDAIILL